MFGIRKEFIYWLCSNLMDIPCDKIMKPVASYPLLPAYIEKIVDGRTFVSIEDKLAVICNSVCGNNY